MELPRRWSIRRGLYRALVTCALLVGLFYLVPVEPEGTMPVRLVRALLTGLGAIVLAVSIAQLVGRLRRDEAGSRPANLLVALFLGLIVFALLDYQVAVWRSDQFVGLVTKTDALYFAVITLATVGYGDVYAAGQWARGLVIVQILYNVAVLATGGAALVDWLRQHPGPPRGRGAGTEPP